MNSETNRLAQLIANAADKELGTRVATDGRPRRQDKAAAQAIEAEYLFIRRADLPAVGNCGCSSEGIELNGDCWDGDYDHPLKAALEHLAVWQYREAEEDAAREAKQALDKRRDELAREIAGEAEGDPHSQVIYKGLVKTARIAIDRIIELERNEHGNV